MIRLRTVWKITNPSIQWISSAFSVTQNAAKWLCSVRYGNLEKLCKQNTDRQRRSWTTARLWFLFCSTRLCFRASVVMIHYFLMSTTRIILALRPTQVSSRNFLRRTMNYCVVCYPAAP